MSSREDVLASIRQHTQTRYDKPDIADMKRLSYPDKIEQFCSISRAVGGTAVVLGEGEDVNAVIRRTYPDAMRIASVLPDISCATFNPDNLDDPKEYDMVFDTSKLRRSKSEGFRSKIAFIKYHLLLSI